MISWFQTLQCHYVTEQLPDVFTREVLDTKLNENDRFLLGQASSACRTFLKADAPHLLRDFRGNIERVFGETLYIFEIIERPPAIFFWAVENGLKWREHRKNPRMCADLAELGNLDVLRWAVQNGFSSAAYPMMCERAADCGHLHVMRWLWDAQDEQGWDFGGRTWLDAFYAAVWSTRWDVVDFLRLALTENYTEGLFEVVADHYRKAWFSGGPTAAFFRSKLEEVKAENKDGAWDAVGLYKLNAVDP